MNCDLQYDSHGMRSLERIHSTGPNFRKMHFALSDCGPLTKQMRGFFSCQPKKNTALDGNLG